MNYYNNQRIKIQSNLKKNININNLLVLWGYDTKAGLLL